VTELAGDPVAVTRRNGLHPTFSDLLHIAGEDSQRLQHPLQHKISAKREGEGQAPVDQDEREQDLAADPQRIGDVHFGEKASSGEALCAQRPRQPGAAGIGVERQTIACLEPAAQFVRHCTLDRKAAWIGRSQDRSIRQLNNGEARFEAGISVALRTIQGIEHPSCVPPDEGRQDGGGETVEIGAGQQLEIALLILGEPPENDLRSCDGNGDHQAGDQYRNLYH